MSKSIVQTYKTVSEARYSAAMMNEIGVQLVRFGLFEQSLQHLHEALEILKRLTAHEELLKVGIGNASTCESCVTRMDDINVILLSVDLSTIHCGSWLKVDKLKLMHNAVQVFLLCRHYSRALNAVMDAKSFYEEIADSQQGQL